MVSDDGIYEQIAPDGRFRRCWASAGAWRIQQGRVVDIAGRMMRIGYDDRRSVATEEDARAWVDAVQLLAAA